MKNEIFITSERQRLIDYESITLEQILKRRLMRRRRVARRMAKRFPLMAVEFMQDEFPGYTWEDFENDISRKKRKSKSYRKPKTKAFDWGEIRYKIPDFFDRCIERTKTKAVLHGRLKTGEKFTCVVRAYWYGEYGECRLRTKELINLWRGPLKDFLSHPAMQLLEHNNNITQP